MSDSPRERRAGARIRPPRSRAPRSRSPLAITVDRAATLRAAARWPLDECLANEDWRDRGEAVVVFVRRAPGGRRAAAGFVVDLCCRGVRQVRVALDVELAAVHDLIDGLAAGVPLRRMDPFLAAKIVRSGHAYATALGLPAHADHGWASAIFDAIDDTDCSEPVPCGRFGKPVVEPGPDTDLLRVLDRLERRLGRGGYHLVAPLEVVPEG